jgi:lipopolysaccharide/colanic/teichoic acid biosynthesis glycosyltransferase
MHRGGEELVAARGRPGGASELHRLFDVVGAALLFVVALPLLLVALAGSALSFRAWPIFTQERVGQHGRPFRFVKVRSLPPTTQVDADKYAIAAIEQAPFGKYLRSSHVDELPQLLLVITGKMSLVGPRPEMERLATTLFTPAFQEERTRVLPGCTGLWQISVDAGRLIAEVPEYDLAYVRSATLRLDLWVLWRTFLQLLTPAAPVTLDDIPWWTGFRRQARPESAPATPLAAVNGHRPTATPDPVASPAMAEAMSGPAEEERP